MTVVSFISYVAFYIYVSATIVSLTRISHLSDDEYQDIIAGNTDSRHDRMWIYFLFWPGVIPVKIIYSLFVQTPKDLENSRLYVNKLYAALNEKYEKDDKITELEEEISSLNKEISALSEENKLLKFSKKAGEY